MGERGAGLFQGLRIQAWPTWALGNFLSRFPVHVGVPPAGLATGPLATCSLLWLQVTPQSQPTVLMETTWELPQVLPHSLSDSQKAQDSLGRVIAPPFQTILPGAPPPSYLR